METDGQQREAKDMPILEEEAVNVLQNMSRRLFAKAEVERRKMELDAKMEAQRKAATPELEPVELNEVQVTIF